MTSAKLVRSDIDNKNQQIEIRQTVSEMATSICHVCNLSATVMPVERLSNNGILMEAIHSDANSTIHRWAEYKSFWDVGQRKARKPITIKCPKCGKMGRINEYKPDVHNKPEIVAYFVTHEKLNGKWVRIKQLPS